jgi:hypothetical protein
MSLPMAIYNANANPKKKIKNIIKKDSTLLADYHTNVFELNPQNSVTGIYLDKSSC